jgi:hypothetical protein
MTIAATVCAIVMQEQSAWLRIAAQRLACMATGMQSKSPEQIRTAQEMMIDLSIEMDARAESLAGDNVVAMHDAPQHRTMADSWRGRGR